METRWQLLQRMRGATFLPMQTHISRGHCISAPLSIWNEAHTALYKVTFWMRYGAHGAEPCGIQSEKRVSDVMPFHAAGPARRRFNFDFDAPPPGGAPAA